MNDEKKIAQAILDAQKMREESYYIPDGNTDGFGEYKLDIADCLIAICKEQGLSENLWALLNLAMHWWNDIQLWAEDVLACKNILSMMNQINKPCCDTPSREKCQKCKPNEWWLWITDRFIAKPCCNTPSKDRCEQCQEIGLANPLNH